MVHICLSVQLSLLIPSITTTHNEQYPVNVPDTNYHLTIFSDNNIHSLPLEDTYWYQ